MKEKKEIAPLTPQEEAIMKALWQISRGEISDIMKLMPESDQPYTTIASMVGKLEENGFVKRTGKRRGFVYAPVVSEQEYYNHSLSKIVSDFFTGSYKDLVRHFAREEKLTKSDLEEILRMIGDEDGDTTN